jgi:hypothetical protein
MAIQQAECLMLQGLHEQARTQLQALAQAASAAGRQQVHERAGALLELMKENAT